MQIYSFYSVKALFLFLSYFTISLSQEKEQVENQCQEKSIQIIYKFYQEFTQNADSLIDFLFQKILSELDQRSSQCLEESCWVSGKELCEKQTNQPCIQNGGFWMAACKHGYKQFGKTSSCISICPKDFIQDGESCIKPNSYSRGVGYSWVPQDGAFSVVKSQLRCIKDNPNVSCEQCGSFSFPKCKSNFKASSCFVCEPVCPIGTEDQIKSCSINKYKSSEQFANGTCVEQNWVKDPILIQKQECSAQQNGILNQIKDFNKSIPIPNKKQVYELIQKMKGYLISCNSDKEAY